MYKFLTVVLVLSFSQLSLGNDLVLGMNTHNLVRLKLWYEGIELEKSSKVDEAKLSTEFLPEEILVPLEQY
jgi:hypothetical protein